MNALNNPFWHHEHAYTVSLFEIKLFVLVRIYLKTAGHHKQITVFRHTPVDYYFSSEFSFALLFLEMTSDLSVTGKQFVALSKGVMMLMRKKTQTVCCVPWQLQQSPL